MSRKSRKSSLAIGLLLVVVGLALLLINLGIIPTIFPHYLLSWKTLLVALGIILAITQKEKTAGIVLAAVGFYFLLPDIWDINPLEAGFFWPILLLSVGLAIIFSRS